MGLAIAFYLRFGMVIILTVLGLPVSYVESCDLM